MELSIERESPIPLYIQVKEYLKDKILSGELKPLERIPSTEDYAKSLGVSPTTLEYALQELSKEDLVFRIKRKGTFVSDKITNIDYKSSPLCVGVVIPDIKDPMVADVLMGIETEITEKGYNLIYVNSHWDFDKEVLLIKQFLNRGIKGLIVYPTDEMCAKSETACRYLKELSLPLVMVDRCPSGMNSNFVTSKNRDGAYEAVDYLIRQGHKNIAHITTKYSMTTTVKERFEGYISALLDNGIEVKERLIFRGLSGYGKKDHNKNIELIREFLRANRDTTAIFTVNDPIAYEVYMAIKKEGLEIPEDISVVGFDDSQIALFLYPSLTTIYQEKSRMGKKAAELLIESIEGKISHIEHIYLPTRLVIRDSVKAIDLARNIKDEVRISSRI
ncbi:MAG: substrate-binding domain-containing protein [bacterium]